MRILVSGFEAFAGGLVNPSQLLCETLAVRKFAGVELATAVLPVTFADSFTALEAKISSFRPDVVLALGQAGGRASIDFERIAVNLIDAEIADNAGKLFREREITVGGPLAYRSSLPLRALQAELAQHKIPSRVSNTAGLYVCNYLFYKLAEFIEQARFSGAHRLVGGFVHLPYLPDQVEHLRAGAALQSESSGGVGGGTGGDGGGTQARSSGISSGRDAGVSVERAPVSVPSMTLAQMQEGLEFAIRYLARDGRSG